MTCNIYNIFNNVIKSLLQNAKANFNNYYTFAPVKVLKKSKNQLETNKI